MERDHRQERLGSVVTILALAGAFGLAGYWIWTESGPFRWLVTLQGHLLGDHYAPRLTGLLVLLITIAPIVAAKKLLSRRSGPSTAQAIAHLLRAPHEALARGTVVVGRDTLIGWPKACAELAAEGVTFRRGGRAVFCPWSVFGRAGQPSREDADTVVLPVEPSEVASVRATKNGELVAEGAAVKAPFFRLLPGHRVRLVLDTEIPVERLAQVFLALGSKPSS